jgi:hypothetical protein
MRPIKVKCDLISLVMNWLSRSARVVDHLAETNVAWGAPLGGGSTLHPQIVEDGGGILTYRFHDCDPMKVLALYCGIMSLDTVQSGRQV